MKFLINEDFKAIRTGEFVKASEESGEFILDSESDNRSNAVLIEIAKANGLKCRKISLESLTSHLGTLELPIMNEKTDTQKVQEIVAAGVAAGRDDDAMLIEIVQSGIAFRQAGKLFNQAMTEGGYRITNKDRKEKGRALLVDSEFRPSDYSEIEEMLETISSEISDTSATQAFSIVRAYCKEFEIELPKPPKKTSGGLKSKVFDWIAENATATKEEMQAFIAEQGDFDQAKVDKYTNAYLPTLEVANKVASK